MWSMYIPQYEYHSSCPALCLLALIFLVSGRIRLCWRIWASQPGSFMGLNSTWSVEEKSGGNDLPDGSAKIHVYHLFKSRWGKEEPSVGRFAASERTWKRFLMDVYPSVLQPWKSRKGDGMGLQRGRRWPIVRYFTVSWGLGELFHVLCFILIVASWKSGFISNKTSPWSTLSLAKDLCQLHPEKKRGKDQNLCGVQHSTTWLSLWVTCRGSWNWWWRARVSIELKCVTRMNVVLMLWVYPRLTAEPFSGEVIQKCSSSSACGSPLVSARNFGLCPRCAAVWPPPVVCGMRAQSGRSQGPSASVPPKH